MIERVVVLLLFAWLGSAWAGELREIELRDGTVLRGQIVSLQNGTYTIQSPTLGELKIPAADVRVIRFGPGGSSSAAGNRAPGSSTTSQADGTNTAGEPMPDRPAGDDVSPQVEEIQRSLAADDSIMDIIASLHDDPDVQAVLSDPQIMQAVQNGDLAVLMANPKFTELLNHPKIQEIQSRTRTNR